MAKKGKIFGTLDQESLIEMYSRFISKPKADFFKSAGLGVIQGVREGINIKMLEGVSKGESALDLIDCRTSGGVFNLGHRHPEIIKAIKEGLDGGLDIGDHHLLSEQRALLAKKIAELMPGDISKTQFCVGGGEAIDLAIKLAIGITKRKNVISAKIAYHGVTGFALGAGNERFKKAFSWNPSENKHVEFGNIEDLRSQIDEETACVIFEPIPATGGILIPPKGYFSEIRDLCDDNGTLMIADEVQTGLGRTGSMWAINGGLYEKENIVPDIMVLAKGMSAGYYPLATCSYKPFIEEIFEEDPFIHISTTGGSELGCYITRKMLNIVSEPSFLDNIKKTGKKLKKGLEQFQKNKKYGNLITEVRGRGLMLGVEFIEDRYGIESTIRMINNGIFADFCGNNEKTIKLMPPLVIKNEDVDEILARLDTAFNLLSAPT